MGRGKGDYDVVLRCRAPRAIKERLERLLERRGHGDLSELLREALVRYVETEEARLGITSSPPFYAVPPEAPLSLAAEQPPAYGKGKRGPRKTPPE